jgi:hypothetical protein
MTSRRGRPGPQLDSWQGRDYSLPEADRGPMKQKLLHWLEWHPWRVIIVLTAAFSLFFYASDLMVKAFHRHGAIILLAYPVTVLFLLYALLTIVAACRVKLKAGGELALTLAFGVGMLLTHPFLLALLGEALKLGKPALQVALWLNKLPGLWVLGNAFIILAAAFLGRLVGRLIREPSLLPVVAIVAAGIDIWGVYWGPVGQMSVTPQGQAIAKSFSAAVPAAKAVAAAGLPALSAIGIGDFAFLAMFFAVLKRLKLNQWGSLWVVFGILLIAPAFFLLGKLLPIAENLPGLPFIALGVIIANWKYVKLSRREMRDAAIGISLTAAVIAGIVMLKKFLK